MNGAHDDSATGPVGGLPALELWQMGAASVVGVLCALAVIADKHPGSDPLFFAEAYGFGFWPIFLTIPMAWAGVLSREGATKLGQRAVVAAVTLPLVGLILQHAADWSVAVVTTPLVAALFFVPTSRWVRLVILGANRRSSILAGMFGVVAGAWINDFRIGAASLALGVAAFASHYLVTGAMGADHHRFPPTRTSPE